MKNPLSKGVALIQVLVICAVISVLALYLIVTAKEQVAIAQLSNDRASATLMIKQAQSQLFLTLLTEFRKQDRTSNSPIVRNWNFHNTPFFLSNGVKVSIQDQAALLSVHFPDEALLRNIFRQLGVLQSRASVFTNSLLDWQDSDQLVRLNGAEKPSYGYGPRNGNISLLNEAELVRGMTPEMWKELSSSFSLYRRSPFNPIDSTPLVLKGILGIDKASQVLADREDNSISNSEFSARTGLTEGSDQIFYPGNTMQITFTATKGQVTLTKSMMVDLNPYAAASSLPVNILETRW